MLIVGVDPGSRVTGYGLISREGNRLQNVCFGTVKGLSGGSDPASFAQRLKKLHNGLLEVLEEYSPHVMAVEEVFHAVNVKSALKLGHARGALLLAAAQRGVPVVEYSALQVKKSVVGYGRAEKGQVQIMVKTLLNLPEPPEPHDAADALAVAICHALNGAPTKRTGGWRKLKVENLR